MLCLVAGAVAQERQPQQEERRRRFSHEEFQSRQKEYITQKAQLTPEEAEAFFPLFFELQNKKFTLEREARKSIRRNKGEKMSDVKIEIARLEKEYCTKYLKVIPACKLVGVQHAETSFQRDLMRRMMQERGNHQKNRHQPNEKR